MFLFEALSIISTIMLAITAMLHIQHCCVTMHIMRYKLSECIGARLRRISRVVDNMYRIYLNDYPVTEQQMSILFFLKSVGECEQGEIGRFLVLERSTVSRNVKALVGLGFISKSEDYRPTLTLSESGKVIAEELVPIWEEIMDKLIDELGEENLKLLGILENKLK